jgi:hypothetical protein
MSKELQTPSGYAALLAEIKERIRSAQLRASFAVSRELVLLYWSIGRKILVRQNAEGRGTKEIDRFAKDLGAEFPEADGFQPAQPQVYAEFSRGLARPVNSATACGTFAVGPSPSAASL